MKIHIPSKYLVVAYHQPGRKVLYVADIREIENENTFLWKWHEKSWTDGKPLRAWEKEDDEIIKDDRTFNYFGLIFPKEFKITGDWETLYQEIQEDRDYSYFHYSHFKSILSRDLKTKKLRNIFKNHKKWLENKNKGFQACLMNHSFQQANLDGVTLKFADLRFSDFRGASLKNVDFSFANLSFSDLSKANLNGANLRGAILHRTNLEGANLVNVDLVGVNLPATITKNAVLDREIKISIDTKPHSENKKLPDQPKYFYDKRYCLQCGREFLGYENNLCPDCALDFACYTEWLVFGEDPMMDF